MTPDSDHESGSAPSGTRTRRLPDVRTALRSLPARVRQVRWGSATRAPWLLGTVSAVWAAAIGLVLAIVPLLIMWMAAPPTGFTWPEATRLGGFLWLVANGTPPTLGTVTYSLVPWGLVIVPALLLGYAGSAAARRSRIADWRGVGAIVAGAGVTYAVIAALVATLSARPGSSVSAADAALHAAVVAVIAVGVGSARAAGLGLADALPTPGAVLVRAGVLGVFGLVGAGAVVASIALLVRVDDAITMAQALHTGFWGGLGLLALGLAFAPVLIVWATAYVLGAGVAIGPGIVVSPFIPVTAPTQLPPFPVHSCGRCRSSVYWLGYWSVWPSPEARVRNPGSPGLLWLSGLPL
jgi:hypothetical protein